MYFLILILSVLLYLSIVVFDFWDIFRRIWFFLNLSNY
jgi:hypothetical protein